MKYAANPTPVEEPDLAALKFASPSVYETLPVLAYHKVDTGFELGVNSITPQAFECQMKFLAEQGYTAITVDGLICAIASNSLFDNRPQSRDRQFYQFTTSECKHRQGYHSGLLNLPPRSILITFDDGYEDFYTYAYPILKKYGLTATVFVLAGYIGKLNTWDVRLRLKRARHLNQEQIQVLSSEGIGFGSHGMYHRFLTRCRLADAEVELQSSKSILEDLLNRPIYSFAYPYGSTNAKTVQRVKSADYRVAFSLNPSQVITQSLMYRFPRIAIYRYDTARSFQAKLGLLGKSHFRFECLKNRIINRFAYLNQLRM